MRLGILIAALVATATPAFAQRVELVTRVTASPLAGTHVHPVGPRYIAMSGLLYHDGATLEVLDLDTQQVIIVRSTRALMAKHFDIPEGELVSYDGRRAGLFLSDPVGNATRRRWYAELDASGALVRSRLLATTDATADMYFVGTDVAQGAAWFHVQRYGAAAGPDHTRLAGPQTVELRRLDLKTLAFDSIVTVPLAARPMKHGYEDRLTVHHARDFARFALVEYDEDTFRTTPPAKVYVIDPFKRTTFAVPALDTTYGVEFSPDGGYLFLASSQAGKVVRVDLAKQRIDRTVVGPRFAHHALISPTGAQLFVLATSTKFVAYDLPGLKNRREIAHSHDLAEATAQLFGSGVASLDRRFLVVPAPSPPGPTITRGLGPPKTFLLARLAD
jgi:hypothetical protein